MKNLIYILALLLIGWEGSNSNMKIEKKTPNEEYGLQLKGKGDPLENKKDFRPRELRSKNEILEEISNFSDQIPGDITGIFEHSRQKPYTINLGEQERLYSLVFKNIHPKRSETSVLNTENNSGEFTIQKLGQPKIVVDEVTSNSIKISWIKGSNAENHKLYYRTGGGGWDNIISMGDVNTFTLEDLPEETSYNFLVQAIWGREKVNSAYADIRTLSIPPVIPVLTESIIVDIELPEDGSDVTDILQTQLDAIPNGSEKFKTKVYFPKGKFNAEGISKVYTASLYRKYNVELFMDGTILYTEAPGYPYGGDSGTQRNSNRKQLGIVRCGNVVIHNPTIEGSNYTEGRLLGTAPEHTPHFWYETNVREVEKDSPWKYKTDENGNRIPGKPDNDAPSGFGAYHEAWEREHGIEISNSENIHIIEPVIKCVWGDGIYIGGGLSKNITITKPYILMNGRQGICAANNVDGLTITDFTIEYSRRAIIDLEPDSKNGFVRNVKILGGKGNSRLAAYASGGRGDVSNVEIDGTTFESSYYSVMCYATAAERDGIRRQNWKFTNNTRVGGRVGSTAAPIKFGFTDNIHIEGNTDFHNSEMAVSFAFCRNVRVLNNNFDGGNLLRVAPMVENLKHSGNTPPLKLLDNSDAVTEDRLIRYKEIKKRYPLEVGGGQ